MSAPYYIKNLLLSAFRVEVCIFLSKYSIFATYFYKFRSMFINQQKQQIIMRYIRVVVVAILFASCLFMQSVAASELPEKVRSAIGEFLDEMARKEVTVGKITVESVSVKGGLLSLFTNINCSYIPFRNENVAEIYSGVKMLLPAEFSDLKLQIITDGKKIDELIPIALQERDVKSLVRFRNKVGNPLVTNLSKPYTPSKGLANRHIALWQSHGFYYESKLTRWEWQRARIFQTVEDLYSQSYVLPFLVPMLENAGANLLLPRDRDTRTQEVIVDNDGSLSCESIYRELSGSKKWRDGQEQGFAHLKSQYIDFENPFRAGTYRQIKVVESGPASVAEWIPDIPTAGEYAVYVSYKTVSNSVADALYTVHHRGGESTFKVNQQMGGGTWIYLGHFGFAQGLDGGKIVLSNLSSQTNGVITADGVKIGGGYGNIARRISVDGVTDNMKSCDIMALSADNRDYEQVDYPYEVSGYPRFCEAARYWLQWAGVPDSVYSASAGINDYVDDYKSRGLWVNYLSGGSTANPSEEGLNIPIDMAFAFHTDAGTMLGDTIVGTLGIFQTAQYDGLFANGASRYASRDLTDFIQSNIVRDIRMKYEPQWVRRGMWNRSYNEASTPRVPTMLLELLSHQNFADMRYGLDPRFRFTVSRAIYKGMLQFISSEYGADYVVQPLPVTQMNLQMDKENMALLSWLPVVDSLEASAVAEKYIVYWRFGSGDFNSGVVVEEPQIRVLIPNDVVCSFKVCALNSGGSSFPSEILSVANATNTKGLVLVVNGFDRVGAPADFTSDVDSLAGFLDNIDHGVPYKSDISYIGSMKEFRRNIPWMDDDASGFGDSYSTHETMVIAGNSFDYPAMHGSAILKAGYSFVSSSDEAVEAGVVNMGSYKFVDLILGKECQTKMGRLGATPLEFKTFNKKMQSAIANYCDEGGNIFVSGSYVGSDLWDNRLVSSDKEDREFAMNVLKYKWRVGQAARNGLVKSVASPIGSIKGNYSYHSELNSESYVVESPDAIEPAAKGAHTILRYSENNISAGVAYDGEYKTCILGFPFEAIRTESEREELMAAILNFFE